MARTSVFQNFVFLLLGLLALGWSNLGHAQSCDLIANAPTTQSGPINTSVTFSFTVTGGLACNGGAGASGDILILTDTTGGATPSVASFTNVLSGSTFTFDVDMGPTTGGFGTVQADCTSLGCGAFGVADFSFATNSAFNYVASGPANFNWLQGIPFTLSTLLEVDGAPGTVSTSFDTTPPVTDAPDGAGIASATDTEFSAITHVRTGTLVCGVGSPTGCAAVPPVNFNVTIEPTTMSAVSPITHTINVGETLPLVVRYGGTTVDAPDGTNVNWTAAPGGGVTLPDADVAGGSGEAATTFAAAASGTYNVTAFTGCTGCAFPQAVTFTVTVIDRQIALENGDGQVGTVGVPFPDNLLVSTVEDDGTTSSTPAGVQIDWTILTGAATIAPNPSFTDAAGESEVVVTPTLAGPLEIQATRADDPTRFVVFNLNATAAIVPSQTTAITPNPATIDEAVPTQFTVRVEQPIGTPLAGATVTWTSNDPNLAVSAPTSLTDVNGEASVDVTGSFAGSYPLAIEAAVDPDGTPATGDESSVVFDVDVSAIPLLDIEQGDGQTSVVGTPFADSLMVFAEDTAGVAAVGLPITWTLITGNATFVSPTSTDASGYAETIVTPTAAGPIQIVAERTDAPGVSVTFNLTATAVPVTITPVTPDPANGFSTIPQTFTIDLDQLGAPVVGATVTWTTTGPFTTSAPTSLSSGTGEASIDATGTGTGTFTNAITATVDVDGIAGTGDEASYSFDVTLAGAPTLAIFAGDGGTADVNDPFPTLEVRALNGGLPAGGITINWVVTGGSATVVPAGPTNFTAGQAFATVTAGATPGPITVTAERSDVPGMLVTFNLTATGGPTTMAAVTPNPATVDIGDPTVFTIHVEQAGAPLAGATIDWFSSPDFTISAPSSTTDVNGDASITVTGNVSGTFPGGVSASVDPDGTTASGDESSLAFTITVNAIPTLTINGGDGQAGTVGTNFAQVLSVIAEDSGTPAVGVTIVWTVTAGSATITPSGPTDAIGEAHLSVTPTAPGPITIQAERADAPGVLQTFNLTAAAAATAMTAVTPDPAALTIGTPTVFTVRVEQAGVAVVGATVDWTAGPDFTLSGPSSTTDVNGDASITVTGNNSGSFPGAITASVDPDGIATSGDEAGFAFDVDVTAVPTLVINGGNGQAGTVGVAYPQVLSVIAEDSGTPTAGVTILWNVTLGSANITPGGPTDALGEATLSVTPTAAGTINIEGERADAPGVVARFSLSAVDPKTLTAVSPNPAVGDVGTPMTFTVVLEQGGFPVAGAQIDWTAAAPFAPGPQPPVLTDVNGEASVTLVPTAAGTFTGAVSAVYDADGIPASGDELNVLFDVTTNLVRTLTIIAGDGQTTTSGTAFPVSLDVLAENNGAPVAGLLINWSVLSGSAIIDDAPVTDAGGHSTAAITASAPGPIQIRAERSDDPTIAVVFNLTAVPAPFVLVTASADPATGTVGVPIPVTVELTQGGAPVVGASIAWTTSGPFAASVPASATDGSGQATVNLIPSASGTYTNALTATYDPTPAPGDEIAVSYGAQINFVAALAITGGDSQSALPGNPFPDLLEVLATNSGTPAVGLGIVWTHTGDITVTPFGPTDATGQASATVVAGTTPGAATVTATRADDPSVSVTFSLTVDAFGTLTVTGGDDQALAAGVPSEPLQVTLKDAGGVPVAGAVITWATSAGTLAGATSTTDAAGVASNIVTVTVPGAVEVTATSPLAGAPAVFALNGALGNLAGLDPLQEEIAAAIDQLCPALGAMSTLTPEEADLLARCEELIDAAGIDPDATIDAIDELMTGLALAQGSASLSAARAQFQNLKTRIAALRSGTVGASFGGLALNSSTGPVSLETLASAFAAGQDPTAPAEGSEIGADFSRWGFFAAGNIGRGEAEEGQIDPAFDYDVEGLTFGVDYRYSDRLIFGAAFGYTRQDTTLPDDRGSVDTTGWSLSAYTTYYKADSWYVDGVLTWGRNDFGLMRRIDYTVPLPGGGVSTVSQVARSDSQGDLLSTGFTVGRDFNRGALGIGPYARLLYTRLGFDEINEELLPGAPGSGLGLTIEERQLTSLASVIGTKFTYTISTDWGVVIPHLQLEWEHEFRDDPQSLQARFLHDPTGTPIVISGDRMDTDYFRLGLGLSMVLSNGRSGFFYYEHMFGRNGESQYNLALGLRLEF